MLEMFRDSLWYEALHNGNSKKQWVFWGPHGAQMPPKKWAAPSL